MHSTHIAKLMRIGSSVGVIIPRIVLNALKVDRGDTVVFAFYGERQIMLRILTDAELRHLQPPEIKI